MEHPKPLQYSTFTHIPVHASKIHSPPRPPERGSNKSQPILLTGLGLFTPNYFCSNPDPSLVSTSTAANTDTRFLSSSWEAYCPGFPRALIPFLSTKLREGCSNLLSLPGFPATPSSHNPDAWHTGPVTTDPILHVDLPVFLSLLICCTAGRRKHFNVSI